MIQCTYTAFCVCFQALQKYILRALLAYIFINHTRHQTTEVPTVHTQHKALQQFLIPSQSSGQDVT